MIEKVKAVNNPLTIIAIFAALAEVAGTVALKIVSPELQVTFIWFVMLFPALLVLLFFITLNFNPKVLYAPSDFKNEENFLNVIGGVNHLSVNLDDVHNQLEVFKTQIIDDAVKQIGTVSEQERARLTQVINNRIEAIQQKVEDTKESAENVAVNSFLLHHPGVDLQTRILTLLSLERRLMSSKEIHDRLVDASNGSNDFFPNRVRRLLLAMTQKGLIEKITSSEGKDGYRIGAIEQTEERK